jgi:beta-lactamase superfamily II metal-dependent hydrolase
MRQTSLRRRISLFAVALAATTPLLAQTVAEVGKALPPWTAGTLEIHQISTGRGNAAFFLLPDGTTMLVDAGAAGDGMTVPGADPRPDDSRTAGDWIVRYIVKVMAPRPPHIDYAVLTHYHADHIGQPGSNSPAAKNGSYKLSGITEVGSKIPVDTYIDRGDSFLPPKDDSIYTNYRSFLAEQKAAGRSIEPLKVGSRSQIILRRDPRAYPGFEIRNVAANGIVWSGEGDAVTSIFPPLQTLAREDLPTENMCSLALRLRYGRFDYFTGGDMPGIPDAGAPEWQSVERAVARAIGPTDVHVVNHHGSIDPESPFFLSTLKSQVMILPAWSATHPSQDALKRMLTPRLYPGPHDVFVTSLREPTKESIGSRVSQLKADHGHIVIRVAPGGEHYQVLVLDDTVEEPKVLSVHGPYTAQ